MRQKLANEIYALLKLNCRMLAAMALTLTISLPGTQS